MAADSDAKEIDTGFDLFSPLKIGEYTLANRVALAPMTRGRATEAHVPTDIMITYYVQRANAGLIITEGTGISQQGLGWYRAPGIWTDEMTDKWKLITDAVHKENKDSIMSLQLWHLGRQAHSSVTGLDIVSASDKVLTKVVINEQTKKEEIVTARMTTNRGVDAECETPKALDEKGIEAVVKDYGKATANSMKAGFDMVEIHGANGYLVDQFLQSCTNERNDKYGGNIENRLLFMKEVVLEVISNCNNNSRKVGIRLSPNGAYGGMGGEDNLEQFDAAIEWLSKQKLGYIHIMDGSNDHKTKEKYTLRRARNIIDKHDKEIRLIGNVDYTKDKANKVIKNGDTDMIAFGKLYMSNPDLVNRFKNDYKLAPFPEYKFWWGWDKQDDGYITFKNYNPNDENDEKTDTNADATTSNQ